MAVKNQKELKKSRVIAIIWVALSLFAAVAIGVLGRAYLYPVILGTEGQASTESVFIEMITKIFTQDLRLPFIGGLAAPGQGMFPKYDAGLYTVGGSDMIVSRGLGNSLFPLRVNNRPEIVMITLEHG